MAKTMVWLWLGQGYARTRAMVRQGYARAMVRQGYARAMVRGKCLI